MYALFHLCWLWLIFVQCLDSEVIHSTCKERRLPSPGHSPWYRTIRFYAAADKRALIQPKLIWATPGQRGFGQTTRASAPSDAPLSQVSSSSGGGTNAPGPSQQRKSHVTANTKAQIEAALKQEEARKKAAELSRILNTLEKVDDEGRRSSLLDSVCASDDVLNLPLHPDPPGIAKGDLLVDLMKHQVPFQLPSDQTLNSLRL